MSRTIDYYYSVMSGFAYLGEGELQRIVASANARIVYKPVDIMAVFAGAGSTPPARQPPARRAYRDLELRRWARLRGLPIMVPPKHWPVAAELGSRYVVAAQKLGFDPGPLSSGLLRAVWAEERDIGDAKTCAEIAQACYPRDAGRIREEAAGEAAAHAFRAATDEAIAVGVFGSPTYIMNDEMFFGQDRLEMLAKRLGCAP